MFKELTDEQWTAIRAACADPSDEVNWLRLRQRIDEAGRRYADAPGAIASAGFGPPFEARQEIGNALDLIHKLQEQLARLPPSVQEILPDPGLHGTEESLQVALVLNENLVAIMPSGNWNQFRNQLTSALIRIWDEEVGDLAFSKTRVENRPYGPLIDFLNHTVLAVTGKAPGPSGAAQSIEAYRKFGYVPLLNQKTGP
ncbi:hypothetical protein AB7008_41665 [Bradyrhizobium sp. 521_C7_N1_3]|uniref:hypothetical protein n=1 Tax=Bradyrhizobium sp. 521_C7_N1_3 TaxID=3240368 RepID=UPI003F8C6F36